MRKGTVWIVAALLLGLGLRGYHYLRDPVVWHDEAAVIVNVLDKDYSSLLGPLRLHQAAPPLFLWVEKVVSDVLGDEPLAMRLPPFLASCAALLLIVPIARRLLPSYAVPWAVLLFACSEQLCRHSYEVKPYAFDVFAATVLISLFVWRERLGLVRQLIAFAVLAPVLLWLSYPSCFLYGGVIVALLPAVWQDRRPRTFAAFGFLVASVGIAFLGLLLGPAQAQQADPVLMSAWARFFPDWDRPWTVPLWTMLATLEVGRYVYKPLGQGIMVLAFIGGALFWRGGHRDVLALLGLPVGLALLASFLHRYPYGGFRLLVFVAPAVLLLAAAAVTRVLAWLKSRHRLAPVGLVLFLLIPVGVAAYRVARPWPVADTRSAAAFVEAHRRPNDLVTGNDWTHLYYFRRAGAAFHWSQDTPASPSERLWVVWTEQAPPVQRFHGAVSLAPSGWRPVERYDSLFTTAALFTRTE